MAILPWVVAPERPDDNDGMGRSQSSDAGGRRRVAPVAALLLATALLAAPFVLGAIWLGGTFASDGPPSCDRPPTVLPWVEQERQWRRSELFTLERQETVQVDVELHSDGAVLDFGRTVYAVPAGATMPAPSTDDATESGSPDGWVRVGHGREAVNEQVDLRAGTWELVVGGAAKPAELRWPC